MIKRIALLFAALLALTAVASPAYAASTSTQAPVLTSAVLIAPGIVVAPATGFNCNTGMLCLYNDANYGGTVTAYSNPALGCHSLVGTPADNQVSSIHNYTTHDDTMDVSTNCNNFSGFVDHAGQSFQTLSGSGYNDLLSSYRVN